MDLFPPPPPKHLRYQNKRERASEIQKQLLQKEALDQQIAEKKQQQALKRQQQLQQERLEAQEEQRQIQQGQEESKKRLLAKQRQSMEQDKRNVFIKPRQSIESIHSAIESNSTATNLLTTAFHCFQIAKEREGISTITDQEDMIEMFQYLLRSNRSSLPIHDFAISPVRPQQSLSPTHSTRSPSILLPTEQSLNSKSAFLQVPEQQNVFYDQRDTLPIHSQGYYDPSPSSESSSNDEVGFIPMELNLVNRKPSARFQVFQVSEV